MKSTMGVGRELDVKLRLMSDVPPPATTFPIASTSKDL
jgi:hypothetical protein